MKKQVLLTNNFIVQFHLNKLKEPFENFQIVFNSFTKGAWGKEERQKNPLKKKFPFDIRIRAHDNKFVIYVDRVNFFLLFKANFEPSWHFLANI